MDTPDEVQFNRETLSRSDRALRFFVVATAVLAIAGAFAYLLTRLFQPINIRGIVPFPVVFLLAGLLLIAGSLALQLAVSAVRLEKQGRFRRWLHVALGIGVAFVAIQSFGLCGFMASQRIVGEDADLAAGPFAAVFVLVHAMHFIIALLFLVFITVQASCDRYDHEYYWGVQFTAWFWHILGIAWMAILFLFAVVSFWGLTAHGLNAERDVNSTIGNCARDSAVAASDVYCWIDPAGSSGKASMAAVIAAKTLA